MDSIPLKDEEALPQDEEVRRAAEMREWIETKISDLEMEVSRLRSMLLLVDNTLRRRSFVSAKELRSVEPIKPSIPQPQTPRPREEKSDEKDERAQIPKGRGTAEVRELRRTPDGELLAKAHVVPEKIVITPSSGIKLPENIPPFKSFFVDRILKGYQSKDLEASKAGTLPSNQVLQYDVSLKDGFITEVTILNYRDKPRLTEILNTATWAFSRMLEKK